MSPKQQSNGGEQTKSGTAATAGDHRAAAIARLAYEKWQARGCPDGDDRRDWFEAEQEVLGGAESGRQAIRTSSPAQPGVTR